MRWLVVSRTQWTWVWVNSRSWWWPGRPSALQSMRLQRVGHDWATELNWVYIYIYVSLNLPIHPTLFSHLVSIHLFVLCVCVPESFYNYLVSLQAFPFRCPVYFLYNTSLSNIIFICEISYRSSPVLKCRFYELWESYLLYLPLYSQVFIYPYIHGSEYCLLYIGDQ